MDNFNAERKLELVRAIREENQSNRQKMKNREQILFGFTPSNYESEEAFNADPVPVSRVSFGFRFRVVLSIILFVGFILFDMSKTTFYGITVQTIQTELKKDITSNLFDFVSEIPYTQSSVPKTN